ncbi:MAG: UDP-N-acetylglucosamine--N-acetylmuramyl-(pentapeptide) pyrophosphoryl-undecaprenol N-acetylglucosamine transferase [Microthrixaceae bacterium]|nr:UDP-N-acetylglucosamine--N-acetylmuramyl-(pentapeptide) pyrophosphoryl-undecaprenol N-acetylglucosamine transferase [Microthrixaceae bacterium]
MRSTSSGRPVAPKWISWRQQASGSRRCLVAGSSGASAVQNLRSVWDLARGVRAAVKLVRRTRPRVVLVLGGYASLGCALGAVIWRAPMVVADQNARAGAVNRLAAPFARVCAVPFESTDLPRKVVTGNPVRPEIRGRAASAIRPAHAGPSACRCRGTLIAVFAGSLGARRINAAVSEAVRGQWSARRDLVVHHVIGARDWPDRPKDGDGGGISAPGRAPLQPRALRGPHGPAPRCGGPGGVSCRGTTVAELTVMGSCRSWCRCR